MTIHLRLLQEEDLPRTVDWMNRADICQALGYLPTFTLSGQLDWFARVTQDNSTVVFAICTAPESVHVGNVGLGRINYRSKNAMLNVFVAEPVHRSKGVGRRACELAIEYAFFSLSLHRIYLQVSPTNDVAIRMYESLGFLPEGRLRDHYYFDGRYEDKLLFGLVRTELIMSPVTGGFEPAKGHHSDD